MSATIRSAPLQILGHAEGEMTPSVTDVCRRILKEGRPTRHIPPCQKYVTIGLFFDGTNNNMIRDMPQKAIPMSSNYANPIKLSTVSALLEDTQKHGVEIALQRTSSH